MNILRNYILKTVVSTTVLVVLLIAAVEMLVAFLNQLGDMNTQGYGVKQAFVFVLSFLPSLVYPLFPTIALIGCLIGLGKLASQSELIVMQASGVSKAQITLMVMYSTTVMLILVTALGEGLGPRLQHFAEHYQIQAQKKDSSMVQDRQGLWVLNNGNFIHIEKISPNGQLLSILRYQFDHKKLRLASVAKKGNYQHGRWVFKDVTESVFSPDFIKVKHYATQNWPISLDPDFVGIANINPNQASLPELNRYIRYLQRSGLYSKPYEFEFWKRVLRPLAALVMIGLAIPFIFGPLRTKPMGFRILIGVIIGFSFYTLNEFLGPFSLLYQIPPLLAAAVPLLIFVVIDLLVARFAR